MTSIINVIIKFC